MKSLIEIARLEPFDFSAYEVTGDFGQEGKDVGVAYECDFGNLPVVVANKPEMGDEAIESVPAWKGFGADDQTVEPTVGFDVTIRVATKVAEILDREGTLGETIRTPLPLSNSCSIMVDILGGLTRFLLWTSKL